MSNIVLNHDNNYFDLKSYLRPNDSICEREENNPDKDYYVMVT